MEEKKEESKQGVPEERIIDFTVPDGETFKVRVVIDISGKKPIPIGLVPPKGKELTDEEKKLYSSYLILEKSGKVREVWAEFYFQQFGVEQKIHGESVSITTVFDPQSKQVVNQRFTDYVKMEENRLKYLLKDWNLTDRFGKIELKRENGQLTGESLNKVLKIQPAILRAILNKCSLVLDMGGDESSDF